MQETMQGEVLQRPDTSSFAFASTFQGEDALRTGEWVLSEDEKYADQESRVRVERCNLEGGIFAADYGLLLDESHKHYAVGASFPEPVDNKGKDLVIQYEVQIRGGAKCGGAYVKMLRGEAGEDMTTLNSNSPYSIMFGPDKCFRDTNKVHFIFQHENPITKEWSEKHFKKAPKIKEDKGFHVYTLHVKADNTFDLYIDTKVTASGSLLEDVTPPVMPPKEVADPDDKQPEDWVTEAMIPDPSAAKPDDWDEDAPRTIEDESAEMPKGWLEDEEEIVPDASSSKPEDWDDEEDGDWEPIMIINPVCETAPGCGKWVRPLIQNPAYKGPWKPTMVDNPEYAGEWVPREIANPEYFEDDRVSDMAPITGLAVEIWSVDGGVWLDNFVVGHDVGAALKLAEATWRPKFEAYEAMAAKDKKQKDVEQAQRKMERDAASPSSLASASQFLVDKARPYLPAAAAPALDAVADNPIPCILTLLAGVVTLIVLKMRKKTRKPSPSQFVSVDGSAPPADGLLDGAPAQGDVEVTRGVEVEEVEVEEEGEVTEGVDVTRGAEVEEVEDKEEEKVEEEEEEEGEEEVVEEAVKKEDKEGRERCAVKMGDDEEEEGELETCASKVEEGDGREEELEHDDDEEEGGGDESQDEVDAIAAEETDEMDASPVIADQAQNSSAM